MSHGTRAIFSYGDIIEPELDLDLCLASSLPIWYSCHLLSSTLAEFGVAAVSGLVLAADKAKRVSFDF